MKKLLIVDDEPAVLGYVTAVAKSLQFEVVQAKDGLEALLAFAEDPDMDALVTDVNMPGVNGFQLAQEIRKRRPSLPILFISGYFDTLEAPPDLLGAEGVHLLPKPVSVQTLASAFLVLLASEADDEEGGGAGGG